MTIITPPLFKKTMSGEKDNKRKAPVPIESPLRRNNRTSHSFLSPVNTLNDNSLSAKFPLKVERLPRSFQSASAALAASSSKSGSFDQLHKRSFSSSNGSESGKVKRLSDDDEDGSFSINSNYKSSTHFKSSSSSSDIGSGLKVSTVQYQEIIFPSSRTHQLQSDLKLLFLQADRLLALKGTVQGVSVLSAVPYSKIQRIQFIANSSSSSSDWFIDFVLVPSILDLAPFQCTEESTRTALKTVFSKYSTLRLNLCSNCGMSFKSIENILISVVRDRKALKFTPIRDQYGEFELEPLSTLGSPARSGSLSASSESISSPQQKVTLATRTYSARVVPSLDSLSASDSVKLGSSTIFKSSQKHHPSSSLVTSPKSKPVRSSKRLNNSPTSLTKSSDSFTYVDPEFVGDSVKLFSFPEGEMDSVMVTSHELARLEPGIWLNDTLIDFELKFIMSSLNEDIRDKVHIFNSFFYRRLASSPIPSKVRCIDDDEGGKDKISGFDRVKSWTRKLNIFEKEFLVIPVNENLHWFLVVICNPGAILTMEPLNDTAEDEEEEDSKSIVIEDEEDEASDRLIARILIFDSLGITSRGRSTGVIKRLRSYLQLEAWDKLGQQSDAKCCVGHVVKVPQQDNFNDCGCFLLQFAEEFLLKCSDGRFTKSFPLDLSNWFPSSTAQNRRELMKKRIGQLSEDYAIREKLRPARNDNENPSSGSSDIEEIDVSSVK